MTIPDSFFQFLNGLVVLDLSETCITRVPNSISDLENLTTLNLQYSRELVYIPSLAKLAKLRHLDLNGCYKLENLPQEMEELVNLECLIIETIFGSIVVSELITKLSNLQCLELNCLANDIEIIEIQQLGRLERLRGFNIQDMDNFNMYIKSQHFRQLTSYKLILGDSRFSCLRDVFYERSITINNCPEIEDGAVQLPDDTQELKVECCHFQMRNLADALPSLTDLTRLACLQIRGCRGLECIWSESSCAKPELENLEVLILGGFAELESFGKRKS